jgi:hypothetical protein
MGRTERSVPDEVRQGTGPRDGRDHRRDPRFVVVQRRKHPGHRPGQQRLARARRADHDDAVPPCEGQLHGSPGLHLPSNLGQVRVGFRGSTGNPLTAGGMRSLARGVGGQLHSGRAAAGPAATVLTEKPGRLGESGCARDVDAAGQSGFRQTIRWHHDAAHPPPRQGGYHRQQAWHGAELAAERKLAEDRPSAVGDDLLRSDENSQRDRQVQGGSALAQLRRGEVDGYPPRRVFVAAVSDGAPDPLARLLQGRVRQSDDREAGQAGGHVHLDPDGPAIEAVERGR